MSNWNAIDDILLKSFRVSKARAVAKCHHYLRMLSVRVSSIVTHTEDIFTLIVNPRCRLDVWPFNSAKSALDSLFCQGHASTPRIRAFTKVLFSCISNDNQALLSLRFVKMHLSIVSFDHFNHDAIDTECAHLFL
jgi:hypothetical protein